MTELMRAHPGYNPRFEDLNTQRLSLIEEMNAVHASTNMHPRIFERRTHEISNKIIQLSAQPEVYPLQAYGLATQLAALNPGLASIAEKVVIDKFEYEAKKAEEQKEAAVKAGNANTETDGSYIIDAIAQDAVEIVNKTKEYAIDADDDTITLSRIAITASMDYMQEQIEEHPKSDLMQQIANTHNQESQQIMAEAQQVSKPMAQVVELQTGYMPIAEPTPEKHRFAGLLRRVVGI